MGKVALTDEAVAVCDGLVAELGLDRPMVLFDLETTGTSPETDRIVEMGALKFGPGVDPVLFVERFNPGVPIPPEASEVHGITDADVAGAPSFYQMARPIAKAMSGCDLAGFGVRRFDVRMLEAEFWRAGVKFSLDGRRVVDAMAIFHAHERRDLAAARRFYLGAESFDGAHSAQADVLATAAVLSAQVRRYGIEPGLDALHEFCAQKKPGWIDENGKFRFVDGVPTVCFGKHSGLAMDRVPFDYWEWMLGRDFTAEEKEIARAALRSEYPQKNEGAGS